MATASVYDLSSHNLTLCGIRVTGAGTGGFIKVTPPQFFDSKDGLDGASVSFRTGQSTGEFELNLLSTEAVNEDLTSLVATDKTATNGSGVGDFLLEDLNSGLEISGRCRISGFPEQNRTAEPQDTVWKGKIFDYSQTYRPRS